MKAALNLKLLHLRNYQKLILKILFNALIIV